MLEFVVYLLVAMTTAIVIGCTAAAIIKPRLRRRYERQHHLNKRR